MGFRNKISYLLLLFIPLLLGFKPFVISTETLQIRIFAHLKIKSFQFVLTTGNYKILADGNLLAPVKINDVYSFTLQGEDSVNLYKNMKFNGRFKYLKFINESNNELKVKIVDPDRKIRVYQGNFAVNVSEGFIRIINEVSLDNYIAGVTEAEAGVKANIEFYKVQAILARTFALAHINKHVTEGFSLCDQVHCQAYFGKPHELSIIRAVEVTKGKVVVDQSLNLIIAAFHSNSGGQTANSEDVWGKSTPYLRSIIDTFSTRMPNAKWERKMLTEDWLSYLKLKHNFPIDKMEVKEAALNFNQDHRKVYLEYNNNRVPLKNIRADLQLKSTYFNVKQCGRDSVVFTGKGYGHGLGMCQEGAMRMAKLGYSYTDILNFYYQDILLIDLHQLSFFKDE